MKYNEAKNLFNEALHMDPHLTNKLSEKELIAFENVMNNNSRQ